MAEALVGGALLSAFLQVLFDRLAKKHVLDYIRGHGRRNIEKQVNKLEKRLRFVNNFLNDVENKQYKDESVKEWLADLVYAVYDAEDVIDDIATEALRKMLKSEDQSQTISRFLPRFSPNIKKVKTIRNIKKIAQRLDELEQERSRLGLEQVAPGSYSSSSTTTVFRETTSWMDESQVYGRDVEKDNIIDLLLPKESSSGGGNDLSVIPIVGMGGIGKTTLAQIAYNENHRLKDHFPLKAWVCVSDDSDVKKIMRTILNSVPSDPCNSDDDLNQLQIKLKKALTGQKFLIVLDDVWDISYSDWDLLFQTFGVGATGSAIIVTTRDAKIASMMGTVDNHYLQPLSEVDCWSVFAHHAFRKTSVDANPNLVKIGKEIVSKCKGLPLAAKSLGGHLCSTEEEGEWKHVLNSKIWDLPEEKNGILPVLKLSYYYLKPHLKRCFAYCSIFSKDCEFEEKMVVLLWMAEGFLEKPEGKMDMEDFGHMCFRELLLRSFFQPSSNKKGRFVMHDLMSDLAQWVVGETCFRLDDSSDVSKIPRKARHSSYTCTGFHDGVNNFEFEVFNSVDYLRTFLCLKSEAFTSYITDNVLFDLLLKLKFLRVLCLHGSSYISELPSSISDQKHLRYLDLSETEIEILPDSVATLYNLQTLLLKNCLGLKKLPEEMGNLINLRHLDISYANMIQWMPPRLGRLTSLRELSDFVVGKDSGSGIGELKNLKHLQGTLRISKLENVIDAQQDWEANILSDKEGLNVLNMEWCSEFDDQRIETDENKVLKKLRPHEKLKELSIRGYGGVSFPTWLGDPSFSNMVSLKLYGCRRCTALPPLGKLEKLKDLRIQGFYEVDKVGIEFYGEGCSNPFPSLETLSFTAMKKWEHWFSCEIDNRRVQVFPHLRKLYISECPKLLGSLPDHLPSLEELTVFGCERLTVMISSLPRLCKLEIIGCQEVVQRSNVDISSLKSMTLENNSRATFLSTGLNQGLTGLEDLNIVGCDELVSLWQNEWSLRQHATILRHLVIKDCLKLVSLVAKEEDEEQGLPYSCRLESLEIEGCENLKNLNGLHHLTSLRELTVERCSRLGSFPTSGLPAMLRKLRIWNCTAMRSVVDAISRHSCSNTFFELLDINECGSLTSFTRAWLLSRVKSLSIGGCTSWQYIWDEDDASSSSSPSLLEELRIYDCPSLTSLSSSSTGEFPTTLKRLHIENCPKLESLRESFHNNSPLDCIVITNCESLKFLPENLHILPRLSEIYISKCPSLLRFPDRGLPASNLKLLSISECETLAVLPPMHDLTELEELVIIDCPSIESFPKEGFPTSITSLILQRLNIRTPLVKWDLHRLASLRHMMIYVGCSASDVVSFPAGEMNKMVLPSSLIHLTIIDFPNLESLSSNGFQNLSSLKVLRIYNCPKLQSFPKKGLFPSLLDLYIHQCPLLKQRCEKGRGQEWPKISHVPFVIISD